MLLSKIFILVIDIIIEKNIYDIKQALEILFKKIINQQILNNVLYNPEDVTNSYIALNKYMQERINCKQELNKLVLYTRQKQASIANISNSVHCLNRKYQNQDINKRFDIAILEIQKQGYKSKLAIYKRAIQIM
jgi:hypothetical protein